MSGGNDESSKSAPLPIRKRPISPVSLQPLGQPPLKQARQENTNASTKSPSFGHFWAVVVTGKYVPPSALPQEPSQELVAAAHVFTTREEAMTLMGALQHSLHSDTRVLLFTCAVHESFCSCDRTGPGRTKPALFCDLSSKSLVPFHDAIPGTVARYALLLGSSNMTTQFEDLIAKAHQRFCGNETHLTHAKCLQERGYHFCFEDVILHTRNPGK